MKSILISLGSLLISFSSYAYQAPSFKLSVNYLGNYQIKYNLSMENIQGIKCVHLRFLRKTEKVKLCNRDENFFFSKVYNYNNLDNPGEDSLEVTYEYFNNDLVKDDKFIWLSGKAPWLTRDYTYSNSLNGFNNSAEQVSEEESTIYSGELEQDIKKLKRTYNVKLDVDEIAVRNVACVYINSGRKDKTDDIWQLNNNIEICSNDSLKLAEFLKSITLVREVNLEQDVLLKCTIPVQVGDRGYCLTGIYYELSDRYKTMDYSQFISVVMLGKDGIRRDLKLPIKM